MDRAGLSGDDGPTHHGLFDIGYLRHIPNWLHMQPKDEDEFVDMLWTMAHYNRSEEHTSELQSHSDLVCRLLLEKKKKKNKNKDKKKKKKKITTETSNKTIKYNQKHTANVSAK